MKLCMQKFWQKYRQIAESIEANCEGLHVFSNLCVIGEVDEELDKRWDLSSVRAEPITSIVH